MPDKVYVGNRVSSLEVGEPFEPISRVTFHVDEEHSYTAGDDTGRHLEYDMPWATQEMVDNALKNLYGFVYRPFKATDAMIDPAAELGDGVTINGQYFMLAQMTTRFDAKGASDIGAPGEKEMDHEYPRLDPVERELKRRVKLGQSYQGARIDRRNGLTIVEVQGDGKEGAKVVLNSKELSFYNAEGGRVLYFDPASGTYKFLGMLNVNDKFIVDKEGNVTMKGSINLSDGSITWGGKGPVKYQFSADGTNWHDKMAANDKYRRDSLDGGTSWGDPYQFKGEDGRDGKDGSNGSDATVPKYITETIIAKGIIEAPQINANEFGVYPSDPTSMKGGFSLHAAIGGLTPEVFKIAYSGADPGPIVSITSPNALHIWWNTAMTQFGCPVVFNNDVDFAGAKVTGLTYKFS